LKNNKYENSDEELSRSRSIKSVSLNGTKYVKIEDEHEENDNDENKNIELSDSGNK